jgi:hypothetical protein
MGLFAKLDVHQHSEKPAPFDILHTKDIMGCPGVETRAFASANSRPSRSPFSRI